MLGWAAGPPGARDSVLRGRRAVARLAQTVWRKRNDSTRAPLSQLHVFSAEERLPVRSRSVDPNKTQGWRGAITQRGPFHRVLQGRVLIHVRYPEVLRPVRTSSGRSFGSPLCWDRRPSGIFPSVRLALSIHRTSGVSSATPSSPSFLVTHLTD